MSTFISYEDIKVVGVTFDNDDGSNRQMFLAQTKRGDPLFVEFFEYQEEPAYHIKNMNGEILGNLPKEFSSQIFKNYPDCYIKAYVTDIIGGYDGYSYGCRIHIDIMSSDLPSFKNVVNISPVKPVKKSYEFKFKIVELKNDILTVFADSGEHLCSDTIQNYTLRFYNVSAPLIGRNYLEVIFLHPATNRLITLKAPDNDPSFEKLKTFCKYMKKYAKVELVKKRSQIIKNKSKKPFLIAAAVLILVFILLSGNSDDPAVNTVMSDQYAQIEKLDIPSEYKSAFKKAIVYIDTMYMSKAALYDQLTSEYGEGFSPEAAQFVVDNLDADYNRNALEKAKSYSDEQYMSKLGIYDQLVSEYGEQFTKEEAQYAIDNLDADYNRNALEKAKSYQDLGMSSAEIRDQLCSEYGEKFTKAEASYAVKNLH